MTKINTIEKAREDFVNVVALSMPLYTKRNQLRNQLSLIDREIERYSRTIINPVKREIDFLQRDGRISNLLISASNPKNKCNFPMFSNAGQIQAVFGSPICKGKLCTSYTTCNEIIHLSSIEIAPKHAIDNDGEKTVIVKKKSGSSSTGSRTHKTKKSYDKSSETVSITFTETGETFTFNVSEGVEKYKEDLEKTFPKSFFENRTDGTTKTGVFAGFKHETFTGKFTNQ